MTTTYQTNLFELLSAKADPKAKAWWEGYVKESAPFLGVKMAEIRAIVQQWHQDEIADNLNLDQQVDLALTLFTGEYTEEKLAGTLFLQEILLPANAIQFDRDLNRFAALFQDNLIYDWNMCDWFCVKLLGDLIKKEGDSWAHGFAAWRDADNLWQARASLVAFVTVAENTTYYPLIEPSCQMLIQRPERFAKTAVGWILRDISKVDQAFVDRVVTQNIAHFSTESLKNATKYLSKEEQNHYRQLLKNA